MCNVKLLGMYTTNQLGAAIRIAINKKLDQGVTLDEIAGHFGVAKPSLYDWMKKGSIDKGKLPKLWGYFSDVVGMTHWGLSPSDFECFGLVLKPIAAEPKSTAFVTPRQRKISALLSACESINDDGLLDLMGYAKGIAKQYPIAKANLFN